MVRAILEVGASSHVGMVRENDEDSLVVIQASTVFESLGSSRLLAIMADGLGGHRRGELASRAASMRVAEEISPILLKEGVVDYCEPLKRSVMEANKALLELTSKGIEFQGMGTTLTSAVLSGEELCMAHVGDSRAYLIGPGSITQISKDHSYVQELVDLGRLTGEEARYHPYRNIITRALGLDHVIQVDTRHMNVKGYSHLLLCCDGLVGHVGDEEIRSTVTGPDSLQEACDRLVGMANERGGEDNISVIVVRL